MIFFDKLYSALATLLCIRFISDLLTAASLLYEGDSIFARVVSITSVGKPLFAMLMLALASMLAPFVALQLGLWRKSARLAKKLAFYAATITAFVWMYLSWMSLPLQVAAAPLVFVWSGLLWLCFAGAIAYSLNDEQRTSGGD